MNNEINNKTDIQFIVKHFWTHIANIKNEKEKSIFILITSLTF